MYTAHTTESNPRGAAADNAAAATKTGSFPWLLFVFSWPLLYWLHNEIDAPSHPYDAQSLSDIVQGAENGNAIARLIIIALGFTGISLIIRYRGRLRVGFSRGDSWRFGSWMVPIAFSYLAWTVMTGLWSTDPALSMRRLVSLLLITIFCGGIAARMNNYALSAFVAVIPALSLVPGILSEMHYGTFNPTSNGYRFGGTAPHPNVEGATLAVSCLLLCWLCWQTRGKARISYALTLFVVAGFLFLTGSRTAILAMLAAIGFSVALVVLRDHRSALPVLAAGLFLVVGLVSLWSVLSSNSTGHHNRGAMQADRDEGTGNTFNGRVDLWKSLLIYAGKRPIRGYGYGSFWSPRRIEDVSGDQGWAIQQSHSAYLDELLALGIPGLVFYVSLLLSGVVASCIHFWRHRDGYGAWSAVFVFILIHDVTESININSGFTYLVFSTLVLHLALVRPDPPSSNRGRNSSVRFRTAFLAAAES